ncbi:hypothetical protein, partial [Escherichia coli]|uniref:hypothetical protein n=2 Tax=Escherichia coli TaxID=562 RepID=UPI001BDBAEBD
WSTSKTPSYTKSVSWQHHHRCSGDCPHGITNWQKYDSFNSNYDCYSERGYFARKFKRRSFITNLGWILLSIAGMQKQDSPTDAQNILSE